MTEKTTYLLPSGLRSRMPAALSIGGLLLMAGVLGYLAIWTDSDFLPTFLTAAVFLWLACWLIGSAHRKRWLLETTVLEKDTTVSNSNAKGTNTVDLRRPHVHCRVVIPYQVGRAKLHLPYEAYAPSELDWDTLTGDGGLKAVERYFHAGAVLIPRELEEKMPQPF